MAPFWLTGKKQLFDDFARVSDVADSAPEAVRLPEAELVREAVAAERQRLMGLTTGET